MSYRPEEHAPPEPRHEVMEDDGIEWTNRYTQREGIITIVCACETECDVQFTWDGTSNDDSVKVVHGHPCLDDEDLAEHILFQIEKMWEASALR